MNDIICFISIYIRTRHFGGPEEGGWYYSKYELKSSMPVAVTCIMDAETLANSVRQALNIQRIQQREKRRKDRANAYANLPETDQPNTYEGDYIPHGWSDGTHELTVKVSAKSNTEHAGTYNDDTGEYEEGYVPYYC